MKSLAMKILDLIPLSARLPVLVGLVGGIIGLLISFFTGWVAVPVTAVVVLLTFYSLAISGFFGWLYGKLA